MNKKRFTIKPQDDYWAVVDNYNTVCITDGIQTDIEYDKVCIINGIHTKIEAIWLCDFMNEQHSIICRDEISIKTMMFNMEKLKEENEKLRKDKEILKERLRECRMKMDKFNCR